MPRVNAHLNYGRPQDRKAEAEAMFEWIVGKAVGSSKPNILLLGDLNFDLSNPRVDLERVIKKFKRIRGGSKLFVSFPSFSLIQSQHLLIKTEGSIEPT